jgi:fructose-bisphosphate aldolase class I
VARRDRHRRRDPDCGAIKSNAHALARYAAICQQSQIVPIVEPRC